jgi:hypothetical protein
MANISQTQTPAQTGPGIPDEALGPGQDAHFEAELERAEKRLKEERSHRFMTDHPDGIGPTLGQDLLRPNPGHGVDWNSDDYDPPT